MKKAYSFFQQYHSRSSNSADSPSLAADRWPDEWRRISYKSYPRFERISLPKNSVDSDNLGIRDCIERRRSRRVFSQASNFSLKDFATILGGVATNLVGDNFSYDTYRAYPSAGARYPLETYLIVTRDCGVKSGLYHYHVRTHSLESMWGDDFYCLSRAFPYQTEALCAPLILVLTGVMNRSYIKYGERAYRYALLEAGHAAQNICLIGAALGWSIVPFGGFHDEKLSRLLDLNPDEEIILHSLLVGQ